MAVFTNGAYWSIESWNAELAEIFNDIYERQKELYVVEYKSDSSMDMYLKRDLQVGISTEGYVGDAYPSFWPRDTRYTIK